MGNELTVSQRFVQKIEYEWKAEFDNKISFSEQHNKLAQHLMIKLDTSFKDLVSKGKNINWNNIDDKKLYTDSVHIINLGLDGLLKNHISVTPYWNKSKNKFDVELYIGYMGKDWIRRTMAINQVNDIRYELVYSSDIFTPLKKSISIDIENYDFQIKEPFNRGEVIGGFGYIEYPDSKQNKLILVTKDDFEKSKGSSKSGFWTKNYKEMCYKTIVHRTCDKIQLDPTKINASFFKVKDEESKEVEECQDESVEVGIEDEKIEYVNKYGDVTNDAPEF